MKYTLVIFDEALIYTIIYSKFNLKILDEIESKIGSIIVSNTMYEKYIDVVKNHENSAIIRDIWRRYLQTYNYFFNLIIDKLEHNILYLPRNTILKDINENNIDIRNIIKMYNSGISKFDSWLIALSHFIKINTNFDPIIISEDSDLLLHGNCISNFFGLCNSFLSIYEALKILNFGNSVEDYLKFRKINGQEYHYNTISKKGEFSELINELSKRNYIAYHPRMEFK